MKVNVDENGKPISYEGTVKEMRETFLQGEWVDLSMIPACLGNDPVERLEKWLEYKKKGVMLYENN